MKLFILFATGLIYLITNPITANETKKCGGPNTEVIINRKLNRTRDEICYGQQIHSHAVIIPAYCIEGVAKEHLIIETKYAKPTVNTRNVSNIFVHPSYSHCLAKNDLAILVFDNTFDSQYDIICVKDTQVVDSDQRRKCNLQANSYLHRNKHYNNNDIVYDNCRLTKEQTLVPSGKYYTEFRTCLFHPNEGSEVIKSFYEYRVWGYEYSKNDEKSRISGRYKLFDAHNWLDQVLQYAIPIALNESISSKEKKRSLDNLNIKHT